MEEEDISIQVTIASLAIVTFLDFSGCIQVPVVIVFLIVMLTEVLGSYLAEVTLLEALF